VKKIILVFCGIISLAVLVFIIASPSPQTKFNVVTIENKFSISVPEYLTRTDSLDSSALLQFKNEKEQLFLIIYEKKDSASLESFFKKFSDNFISKLENGNMINYYPEKINNSNNVLIGNIRGNVNDTKVFYKLAVIKIENTFYKLLFGVSENQRMDYEEEMDKIIKGFRKIS
jgi:hypothetical protein